MKFPAKGGADFAPVPAGNHVAYVYQIIHLGTVPDTYMGQPTEKDKVRLTFELSHERKEFKEGEGEKPYSISKEFTASMNSKATLRKTVEGILGATLTDEEAESFDLEDLFDTPCLLNVVHEESKDGARTFAKIKGTSPLPKGMTAPGRVNDPKVIDVNTASDEEIDALPQFLKDKIYSSVEWRLKHADLLDSPLDYKANIPF